MRKYILYDCDCRLCAASVRFVKRHDPNGLFLFVPLHSKAGQELLAAHGIGETIDTAVMLDGGKALTKSDAVFAIVEELEGFWRYLAVLRFLPKRLRDGCYELVSKYRYRLFGKKGSCDLPDA
jgi:predicted DCC family thiol-disulfide oxidoreductase YuxK